MDLSENWTREREKKNPSKPEDRSTEISELSHKE